MHPISAAALMLLTFVGFFVFPAFAIWRLNCHGTKARTLIYWWVAVCVASFVIGQAGDYLMTHYY